MTKKIRSCCLLLLTLVANAFCFTVAASDEDLVQPTNCQSELSAPSGVGITSILRFDRRGLIWTKKAIHLAMTALVEAYRRDPVDFKLNADAMKNNTSPKATAAIQAVLGPRVTTAALLKTIQAIGDTWDAILQRYGIDPAEVRLRQVEIAWSKEKIRNVLRALYEAGFDVRFKSIHTNKTAAFEAFMETIIGKKVRGAAVTRAIGIRYEQYCDAIRDAEIPYGALIPIEPFTNYEINSRILRHKNKKYFETNSNAWHAELSGYVSEEFIGFLRQYYIEKRLTTSSDFMTTVLIPYILFWQELLGERKADDTWKIKASDIIEQYLREQGAQLFLLSTRDIELLHKALRARNTLPQEISRRLVDGRSALILALRQLEWNANHSTGSRGRKRFYAEILSQEDLENPDKIFETLVRMVRYF